LAQIYSLFLKEQKNNGHIKGLANKKGASKFTPKRFNETDPG